MHEKIAETYCRLLFYAAACIHAQELLPEWENKVNHAVKLLDRIKQLLFVISLHNQPELSTLLA